MFILKDKCLLESRDKKTKSFLSVPHPLYICVLYENIYTLYKEKFSFYIIYIYSDKIIQ